MALDIPETHRDLIEEPVFVTLTTLMPDNQPQSTVVWCDADADHILINSTQGRQKTENMRRRPQATIMAIDPENPFRYVEIRGRVAEITEEGAAAHIDKLAQRYVDQPAYYGHVAPAELAEQETRVICKIAPTRIRTYGE